MNSNDFLGIIPELIVVLTALVAIVVDVRNKEKNASASQGVTIIGLAVAGILALFPPSEPGMLMSGQVFNDGFASWFRALFCFVGVVTAIYSPLYLRFRNIRLGEYYSLLTMCVFGMMVMSSAASLLLFFVGPRNDVDFALRLGWIASQRCIVHRGRHEISRPRRVLVGLLALRNGLDLRRYRFARIQCDRPNLARERGHRPDDRKRYRALLLVGFAFKVSAVPFHFWSPDVYEGAPTSITAFMSTGAKAAAFIGLIRVFGQSLASTSEHWITAISVIAALTMTFGNFSALRQVSVKRMLAYSSVAHAGYLLVGIVAGTREAYAASGFYLIGYALMNLGAFGVLMLLNQRGKGDYSFDSLRGMGTVHPVLGLTMTVFMLSLIGIPPTAGFFGKLYVFSAAIKEGHIILAIIGLLNSAVAAYYYLKVISTMYMAKPEGDVTVPQPMPYKTALAISSILIIVIGLFPDQLVNAMLNAVP
jgi:NADH-quinone oxidoreductase subunit N